VGIEYESFLCDELGSALHFVNTRSVRYRCPKYNVSDFVIVPPSIHYRDMINYRKVHSLFAAETLPLVRESVLLSEAYLDGCSVDRKCH
jgi:hypothetical protein